MTDAAVLSVEDLSVAFGTGAGATHPVRAVSLSIARGETLCLVGESGSGKSMTALALMGLLPRGATRTATRLAFGAESLLDLPPARLRALRGDRIAMVFQDATTALNPLLTIGEQLAETYLRHRGGGRAAARERAVAMLERVGITAAAGRLGQYPHQLSGGLRQRVMIAMALLCEPRLVIADEPTTALDTTVQAQILALLRGLQAELGMALLLITHDLGVVAQMADRVAVLYAGQVVESGATESVLGSPRHPYTRGLLACVPQPGHGRGAPLGTIPGMVPSRITDAPGCSFAPRCGLAGPDCAAAPAIPLAEPAPGHRARCLRSAA